ncbi:hypothetical protein M0R45_030807 [Rubus argutus]|uniref:Uncharacterized protein n=1 Tax=Rubus argutus TaxID=59490 RepID=A0AAW1WEB5_RUBAR
MKISALAISSMLLRDYETLELWSTKSAQEASCCTSDILKTDMVALRSHDKQPAFLFFPATECSSGKRLMRLGGVLRRQRRHGSVMVMEGGAGRMMSGIDQRRRWLGSELMGR